jgi:hypothetical protein
MANKALVLTMPARGNFGILTRHKGLLVLLAAYYRTRRWHGRTMQALGTLFHDKEHTNNNAAFSSMGTSVQKI